MAEQEVFRVLSKKEILQDSNWCFTTLLLLLDDHNTHDVTFKTSDGGSVSGHRAIVAAGSPVFHAMLYGNMKESSEKEIELLTVDTETFKALLSFMYSGKIEVDSKNFLSILETAHYFNIATLENKCVDLIATLLDTENCCTIATFAYDKMFNSLLEKSLTYMYSNAYTVIRNAAFKSLPSELMLRFCQSSDLCVKEIHLFLAVIEWCQCQQNKLSDDTINNVLQQIRYPLISISDLISKVHPTKVADSILYKTALKFHLIPSKYDGPKVQIIRRKLLDFKAVNLTTNTMTVSEDGPIISITKRSSSNGWNGLGVVHMSLTEHQYPVKFKFILKQSNTDLSGIQIVVKSCLESELSASDFSCGVDVNGFTIGENVNGMITMKEGKIQTTIGHKIMTTTRKHDSIYLCAYLYYANSSVSFIIEC